MIITDLPANLEKAKELIADLDRADVAGGDRGAHRGHEPQLHA